MSSKLLETFVCRLEFNIYLFFLSRVRVVSRLKKSLSATSLKARHGLGLRHCGHYRLNFDYTVFCRKWFGGSWDRSAAVYFSNLRCFCRYAIGDDESSQPGPSHLRPTGSRYLGRPHRHRDRPRHVADDLSGALRRRFSRTPDQRFHRIVPDRARRLSVRRVKSC